MAIFNSYVSSPEGSNPEIDRTVGKAGVITVNKEHLSDLLQTFFYIFLAMAML